MENNPKPFSLAFNCFKVETIKYENKKTEGDIV